MVEIRGLVRRHWGSAAARYGELKNHSPDGFLPRFARPFPSLFIQTKKPMTAHGLFYLVEIRGLEPLASALRTPRYTNLAISPRHKIFYNISARNARVLFWLDGTNFAAGQKNLLFPIDFRPPNKYTIPCPLRRTQLNTAA